MSKYKWFGSWSSILSIKKKNDIVHNWNRAQIVWAGVCTQHQAINRINRIWYTRSTLSRRPVNDHRSLCQYDTQGTSSVSQNGINLIAQIFHLCHIERVAARKWSCANPRPVASTAHLSVMILDHLSRHQSDGNYLKGQRHRRHWTWVMSPVHRKCASAKVVIFLWWVLITLQLLWD